MWGEMKTVLMVIFGAVAFVGGIMLNFQIYKMTLIDAKARGLKYPKFWGIFNMGSNNASGNIILYLIGRRRFPVLEMSAANQAEIQRRKKNAGVALFFLAVGTLGFTILLVGGEQIFA